MVASTDIKFYVHSNNNAPQLSNNFGCMIDVLDACLVNGFGAQSVSTLKATGKVVTVTFGAAHNFMQYQVVKITGANQSEFNGEHRILSVPSATTLTYEIANTASVAQATGTIVCSLPPLGWEKPFSSVNGGGVGGKAAYRSTNLLLASRPFLRVVDELDPAYTATYAKFAKVGIVEDMTDINTMLGVQAPYDSANPDKNWVGTGTGAGVINGWARWYYAVNNSFSASTANDSTAPIAGNRAWILVGTSDYFYILPCAIPNNTFALPYGFGAFNSLLNVDQTNTFLSTTLNNNAANNSSNKQGYTALVGNAANQKLLLQRGYVQNASPVEALVCSLGVASTIYSGTTNYVGAFSLTSVSPFSPLFINEVVLRGEVPNMYWLLQNKPYTNYELLEKQGALYIVVAIGASSTGTSGEGQMVLKIGDL